MVSKTRVDILVNFSRNTFANTLLCSFCHSICIKNILILLLENLLEIGIRSIIVTNWVEALITVYGLLFPQNNLADMAVCSAKAYYRTANPCRAFFLLLLCWFITNLSTISMHVAPWHYPKYRVLGNNLICFSCSDLAALKSLTNLFAFCNTLDTAKR